MGLGVGTNSAAGPAVGTDFEVAARHFVDGLVDDHHDDDDVPMLRRHAGQSERSQQVSLCHFTGGTNFVLNMPSLSALDAHLTHHGDCYKKFNEPQVCIT